MNQSEKTEFLTSWAMSQTQRRVFPFLLHCKNKTCKPRLNFIFFPKHLEGRVQRSNRGWKSNRTLGCEMKESTSAQSHLQALSSLAYWLLYLCSMSSWKVFTKWMLDVNFISPRNGAILPQTTLNNMINSGEKRRRLCSAVLSLLQPLEHSGALYPSSHAICSLYQNLLKTVWKHYCYCSC